MMCVKNVWKNVNAQPKSIPLSPPRFDNQEGVLDFFRTICHFEKLKRIYIFALFSIKLPGIHLLLCRYNTSKSLTTLKLWYTKLSKHHSLFLSKALQNNSTLTKMQIYCTTIGDINLFSLFFEEHYLKFMNLYNCRLSDIELLSLSRCMYKQTRLTTLKVYLYSRTGHFLFQSFKQLCYAVESHGVDFTCPNDGRYFHPESLHDFLKYCQAHAKLTLAMKW